MTWRGVAWRGCCRLKHSVGQKALTWPHLAAATALAASDVTDGEAFLESPPFTPSPVGVRTPLGKAFEGGRGDERRSQLRATFPGEPPLDLDLSPAGSIRGGGGGGGDGGGSTAALSGGDSSGERQGFAAGAQQEEGYMSFAALR